MADVPDVDPSTTTKYLAAFVSFWDMHRQPVELSAATVRVNAALLVVALFLSASGGRSSSQRPMRLLMRFVAATAR